MNLEHLLSGLVEVDTVDKEIRRIQIDKVIWTPQGEPIVLVDQTGDLFNWRNVVSVRRVR